MNTPLSRLAAIVVASILLLVVYGLALPSLVSSRDSLHAALGVLTAIVFLPVWCVITYKLLFPKGKKTDEQSA